MRYSLAYRAAALLIMLVVLPVAAQDRQNLILNHADELEVIYENGRYVTYVSGNVDFQSGTGHIYSDSARFVRGEQVVLRGNVLIDDEEYRLRADSVHYDLVSETAIARGNNVQLWSYDDSLYAAGTHAFFDRRNDSFQMEERPTIYIGYPDTANMVEVIANFVDYDAPRRHAEAIGDVVITSQDIVAHADCAVMGLGAGILDLYDGPVAQRGRSTLTGGFISITFGDDELKQIDVVDSAYGEFTEPVDSAETEFDRSILRGSRIKMFFEDSDLREVLAYGQAYSWYYPSRRGTREIHENTVSGDTIRFFVEEERLQQVVVKGGAQGTYVTGKAPAVERPTDRPTPDTVDADTSGADTTTVAGVPSEADTSATDTAAADITVAETEADAADTTARPSSARVDTIQYRSDYIRYSMLDSIITLRTRSEVQSGPMALKAHDVTFDTRRRVVEAYSAEIDPDKQDIDFYNLAERLQPATIPVILKDGEEELLGDYLEYSIDTEKGRIVQTKSEFQQGYYYGGKLFREKRDVYYIEDGHYTTCNAASPHYHFFSPRMKLMENNKLIARPVVFYIGRLPILAIPYYVFPLKKGRHSGFLPFTFGRFERGERYVDDLGYYWAASEYWDWRGAIDYFEQRRMITVSNRVQFRKRYVLDGSFQGEYRRETQYNSRVGEEATPTSYSFAGSYNHNISPSFTIRSNGSYVSRASYYTDYSNSLAERLNRELLSQVNFSKQFGRDISVTGSVQHRENLDLQSRTDQLPTLNVSLPSIYPFGASSTNDEGDKVSRWYNQFILRYTPSLVNSSSRNTVLAGADTLYDTTIVFDTAGNPIDTNLTLIGVDSVTARSRKHYIRMQHNPSLSLPTIRVIPYVNIVPRASYSETWFKIFETDQSIEAGIDASEFYRTYSYNAGVSANTKLYGTIYPNLFGLVGLRHVFEPSVGYSWSPDIQLQPEVRRFAGGGAASSRSQRMEISLSHLFQAKLNAGGVERNMDLLSVTSSFSYDFEQEERPLSGLSTSFSTTTIPRLNIRGGLSHTFYNPYDATSNDAELFSPWLTAVDLDVSFQLAGKTFFFTDGPEAAPPGVRPGADSLGGLVNQTVSGFATRSGWNLAVTYSFTETGLHSSNYRKTSFVNVTLGFGLTPSTSVNYLQRYDIKGGRTISTEVNIVRDLHCWTGSLFWVPVGSNQGFGFKIWVTELPDIKLDSNHDTFLSTDVLRR